MRWWCPQSSTRLSRAVVPPSAQWVRWWAWPITGGRVQPGNAQCRSRQTRARHRAGVTRRWARPTSRTSPLGAEGDGDDVGVAREAADGGGAQLGAVVTDRGPVDLTPQGVEAGGDRDPRPGTVGVGGQVGGQGVLAGQHQRVPHPGAVVTHVLDVPVAVLVRRRGGGGLGERQEGGLDPGGVLDGAAAPDPDAAGTVLGEGEEPAEVRGAVLPLQVLLGLAFGALGVDDVDEVARGLGEVGGVQPPGLVEQLLLRQLPEVGVGGQLLDRIQMTPACSGETSPSRSASRVSDRSPTRSLAWRTAPRPVRGGCRRGG